MIDYIKNITPGFAGLKTMATDIVSSRAFDVCIYALILIYSLLIGVETYVDSDAIDTALHLILIVFAVEVVIRMVAADTIISFFKNGWNVFDLVLVAVGFIPETIFVSGGGLLALRVLRVFRIFRLMRMSRELRLIVEVMSKSITALFYNIFLMCIFMYLFAIIGVILFRMPDKASMNDEMRQRYEEYQEVTAESALHSVDPFGTLGESMFTLFRELTGDDWAAIRYHQVTAYELGVIRTPPHIINLYHILWFVLSVFLLLNVVTGAVINNYQIVMEKLNKDPNAQ